MVAKQIRKCSRGPLVLLMVTVITVLAGGAFFWYHHMNTNQNAQNSSKLATNRSVDSVDYGPSSAGDNAANNTRKSSPSPAITLNNGPTATSDSNLSAQIVNASVDNGNIHIGTLVNGATSGTCTIIATQGQTTITLATIAVQQDVNNYDCGGGAINVPTSQLSPQSGTWQLKLTVVSGSSQVVDNASINL